MCCKDMEKLKPCGCKYELVWMVNGIKIRISMNSKWHEVSLELKTELLYDPALPLLCKKYTQKDWLGSQRDTVLQCSL
jgi:hypothetical protein